MRRPILALSVLALLATALVPPAAAAPPLIHEVAPTAGEVGTSVLVRGEGLLGTTNVTLGGRAAAFAVANDTALKFLVPDLPPGTYGLHLVDDEGAAGWCCFTVVNGTRAPSISDFAPREGPRGTVVTVYGEGFFDAREVRLGGTPVRFEIHHDTKMSFRVPPHAAEGAQTIAVLAGTAVAEACCFAVLPSSGPTLHGVFPSTVRAGEHVRFFGDNLGNVTNATVGGWIVPVLDASPREVFVAIPPWFPEGTFDFGVRAPEGSAVACCLTVLPAPRFDLEVEILGVDKRWVGTDYGPIAPNPLRYDVLVAVANAGPDESPFGQVQVHATGEGFGGNAYLGDAGVPPLAPGERVVVRVPWSVIGDVGDVRLHAQGHGHGFGETDWSDNFDEARAFVLVQNLGGAVLWTPWGI